MKMAETAKLKGDQFVIVMSEFLEKANERISSIEKIY